MKVRGSMSPKTAILVSICAATIGGAVWGVMGGGEPEQPPSTLPVELSADALKKQMDSDPSKFGDTMRSLRDRDDLTPEQERELRRNMRGAWQSALDERVDEYFAAEEGDREAVLDKQIEEFQEFRKDRERRRKEREADGEEPNAEERRERMRQRFASQTREERKERSESRGAESMARRMAYFQAVRARASEKGIEMGGRGRGGGGRRGGR